MRFFVASKNQVGTMQCKSTYTKKKIGMHFEKGASDFRTVRYSAEIFQKEIS